jgi:CBS domain-containing protein
MQDIAEFLRAYEPFSGLEDADIERLAECAKAESVTAGTVIFGQGDPPPNAIRLIRSGSVELVDEGRVLDRLEKGEMFGQAWMFSGLPAGWEARAREDTVCYAFAAEDVLHTLRGLAGLRFVARSLLLLPRPGDPDISDARVEHSEQPAKGLIGEQPPVCEPRVPVREAARRMAEHGATSLLVRLEDGNLGIVTDHDLRSRVLAEGLSPETPVREVVTTPVVTAGAEDASTELMHSMLDHGIRHLPVLSATDELLGVVRDLDLLAAQARTPFALRRAISNATNTEELRDAAAVLNPTVVDLYAGGLVTEQISAIFSVVVEALIRRMVELAIGAPGPEPTELAWLSLGSHGRREAVPSSDVDSGMVWEDGAALAAAYTHRIAVQVDDLLRGTWLKSDTHGVTASSSVMARPASEWRVTIGGWLDEEPTAEALMAISVLLDGRTIYGPSHAFGVFSAVREARRRTRLLRLLLRLALANKPPTGFLRDIVVEHSGEHRGSFDIKRGGLLPIVGIARYAGLAAGTTSTSTVSRLRAAGAAGVLHTSRASSLEEAYRLLSALRMEHQVRQLESGTDPDDHIHPKALDALTRRYLREAFRLVGSIQTLLAKGLVWNR